MLMEDYPLSHDTSSTINPPPDKMFILIIQFLFWRV